MPLQRRPLYSQIVVPSFPEGDGLRRSFGLNCRFIRHKRQGQGVPGIKGIEYKERP